MAPILRAAREQDWPAIRALYAAGDYAGTIASSDAAFVACQGDEIVGVVRLATEHDTAVLRGMQIHADHRGRGIGRALLGYFVASVAERDCYCIPYPHLLAFYGAAGFVELDEAAAPDFLVQRLAGYRALNNGKHYALMVRPADHHKEPR
ncbi:GNAT family N-acetyltransferase [Chitinolyticbacter meiyuanensis]|uniref:GNAT family N-acetyltransferase n=1 Tax=Chitinolyticbacter meiyuanensis TaxID=682798 RepID=UPI0011E58F48|nr:GNAT family N-acetyltransferase [Chitinolyticbacter meiyuanensis]